MPRDIVVEQGEIFDVQLSIDGEKVYYRKKSSLDTLFYRMLSSSLEKHVAIKENIKEYQPTYLGGVLVVTKDTKGANIFNVTSDRVEKLTPFEMKDAEILAFSQKLNSKAVAKITSDDPKNNSVFIIDLYGGAPRRVGFMGKYDTWVFDNFLHPIAGRITNEDKSVVLTYKNSGRWDTIQTYAPDMGYLLDGYQQVISASKDGQYIYYTDNADTDKTVLMSFNIASGEKKKLASDDLADLLHSTALLDGNGKPLMIAGYFADIRRQYISDDTKDNLLHIDKEMRGNATVLSQSLDGNYWLVKELINNSNNYYHFSKKDKKLKKLFNNNPVFEKYPQASRTAFSVGTRDALQLPVHVYLPADADTDGDGVPEEALPTVIFVHGGPWGGVNWDSPALLSHFQLLANRGYVVINTEFRGSTGLGKKFTDAGDGEWGGKMRLDIEDVARWAKKKGISKKGKIALWGHSYGGYAAMLAASMSSDEFACTISMSGLSDLTAFLEGKTDNQLLRSRVADITTDDGRALASRYSPINHVKDTKTPILLVAGGQDVRVDQSQSDMFAEAMSAAGQDVVYISFPEEGHSYIQANTWVSFWAIAEQFLNKHFDLDNTAVPAGEDLDKGFYDVIFGEDFIESIR